MICQIPHPSSINYMVRKLYCKYIHTKTQKYMHLNRNPWPTASSQGFTTLWLI